MFDRDRGTDAVSAFLGKGSHITGTLVFEGPCRIEGHIEGEISASDTLVIAESAVVNARIKGATIEVHGSVTGDVVAEVRLQLRAPSKVTGDITTPSLVIHDGAMLEGRCSMPARQSGADGDRQVPPPPSTASAQLKAM